MELQDTAANRICISFPLGLALLFASFILLIGFFCCCLHWNKLQYLFGSSRFNNSQAQLVHEDLTSYHQKLDFPIMVMKQEHAQSLPVLMPGDEVPKFIAMACPRQPPRDESITIHVQKEAPSDFCSGN
ncbi:hypothetical protein Lal_00048378 [Lupinus albus]|uniref:Uncharacterized protein n=1 Tax=Lupinus albus TaxID=3870 RepID=A0A6A4QP24_LUPAL|nr:hypothetical protein Lalb_Chr04g0252681 [Lupinus albus]KAF1869098.1 hypothetical protein Lal_00048378 [Lupinus albus]